MGVLVQDHYAVFIDSCAWNVLCEFDVDLLAEFPSPNYCFYLPSDIFVELEAIPECKGKLLRYINAVRAVVQKDDFFGFDDAGCGFDQGRFISEGESQAYDELSRFIRRDKRTGSGLYKNQADVSLAMRSVMPKSIVLTAERETKPGPLKKIVEARGSVVFLSGFNSAKIGFNEYVFKCLRIENIS